MGEQRGDWYFERKQPVKRLKEEDDEDYNHHHKQVKEEKKSRRRGEASGRREEKPGEKRKGEEKVRRKEKKERGSDQVPRARVPRRAALQRRLAEKTGEGEIQILRKRRLPLQG